MSSKRSSGSWLIVLFVISVIATVGYFCFFSEDAPLSVDGSSSPRKNIDCISQGLPENGWLYSQLDETERMIYDTFYTEVSNGGLSHTFDGVHVSSFDDSLSIAVRALTNEHPEFFWLNGGYSYTKRRAVGSAVGTYEVTLSCYDYWTYTSDAQKYIDTLEQKAEEIVAQASAYSTDYERVLFVHDYIVKNVDYNHEAADETAKTVRKASSEQAYSAYGCIVDDQAICGGYSKGFQLLMTMLDIECIYVTGYGSSEYHGWNCVRIGEDYYLIDLTWDDPGTVQKDGSYKYSGMATYTYFALTSEQMGRTHTPDSYFTFPECDSTDFNYYRVEGLCLDSYSIDAVNSVLNKQTDTPIIVVAFSNEDAFYQAEGDIIGKSKFSQLSALPKLSVQYSTDTDNYVLKFYLE